MFRLFSRKFESGSNHDFVNDLETSASLYVQLCMARYLMVNKVQEKQDAKQFTKKSWMTSFMQKQFLEEFSKKTNIFKPSADLDLYAKLIVKLKGLPELSSSTKFAVIAFSLMDPDVVRQQFRSAEEFRDLASLVEVLKSMAFFFSENIFQWNLPPAPFTIVEKVVFKTWSRLKKGFIRFQWKKYFSSFHRWPLKRKRLHPNFYTQDSHTNGNLLIQIIAF